MDEFRCLVVGHSFVVRLKKAMCAGALGTHMGFKLHQCNTILLGRGGLGTDGVKRLVSPVMGTFQPHIIHLEIGTNDLCCSQPSLVGSKILDLVQWFREWGVLQITAGQVLFRQPISCLPDFNSKVVELNSFLQASLSTYHYASFWAHHGMWSPTAPVLSKDGVHLNEAGMHLFYRSLRGALLKSSRNC